MRQMAWPSFNANQDVIKKGEDKFMYKGFKYCIHETLKGGGCIEKAKGNHQELILAFMSAKISFVNIYLLLANLTIA